MIITFKRYEQWSQQFYFYNRIKNGNINNKNSNTTNANHHHQSKNGTGVIMIAIIAITTMLKIVLVLTIIVNNSNSNNNNNNVVIRITVRTTTTITIVTIAVVMIFLTSIIHNHPYGFACVLPLPACRNAAIAPPSQTRTDLERLSSLVRPQQGLLGCKGCTLLLIEKHELRHTCSGHASKSLLILLMVNL